MFYVGRARYVAAVLDWGSLAQDKEKIMIATTSTISGIGFSFDAGSSAVSLFRSVHCTSVESG